MRVKFPPATYSELADDDHNMLVQAEWPRQQREFMEYLQSETRALQEIVQHHLSLPTSHEACVVAPVEDWASGSFNVLIPVTINDSHRVAVRCPWPHRMHSLTSPNMAGEKIRGEAATYAWIASNCPTVPIPRLLGFGLPGGRSFTPISRCSWIRRVFESLRQRIWKALFSIDCWRPYAPSANSNHLRTGYLITDFIEPHQGKTLMEQWPCHNPAHRLTLFRSLSNIILDLVQIPMPRIGSFTVSNEGQVTLSGRPLTAPLALLEAEGVPSDILPSTTYASVDTYLEDLLHCHDTRMLHQPNAVEGRFDAEGQLATIVLWKAIRSHFTDPNMRYGPFALQLTDLNESNIFVDDRFNITAIVDLEWTCSLPLEMLQLPFWISGHVQDDFVGATEKVIANEKAYDPACRALLEIFTEQQNSRCSPGNHVPDAASVIRAAFEKKSHFYFAGLKHPRVAYSFLVAHLQPLFAPSHLFPGHVNIFDSTFAPYYRKDVSELIDQKVEEKAQYDKTLRMLYDK